MMHDVIEVHAGDISAHLPENQHPDRRKAEKLAAQKLKKQWPGFKSMHELIDEYEAGRSPEAKFVYALDKLIPILNIYVYEGRSWQLMNIGLDDVKRIKAGKFDGSPEVEAYYEELLATLEKNPKLFGKSKK